jgi:hypothetical protein
LAETNESVDDFNVLDSLELSERKQRVRLVPRLNLGKCLRRAQQERFLPRKEEPIGGAG